MLRSILILGIVFVVIPAEAGIHGFWTPEALDPGFRRDDVVGECDGSCKVGNQHLVISQ